MLIFFKHLSLFKILASTYKDLKIFDEILHQLYLALLQRSPGFWNQIFKNKLYESANSYNNH